MNRLWQPLYLNCRTWRGEFQIIGPWRRTVSPSARHVMDRFIDGGVDLLQFLI